MAESVQHTLDRVRPPRVQITYDVQIGDAIEVKELPLVVGVLADLSGDGAQPDKLRDRQFVEIDRDSFKDIFAKINPRSSFTVGNVLKAKPASSNGASNGASQATLKLDFNAQATPKLDNSKPLDALLANLQSDDPLYMFNPLWIIRHTPDLNTLYEARGRLSDLLSKLDGNDNLQTTLKTAAATPADTTPFALDATTYPSKKPAAQVLSSGTPDKEPDKVQDKAPEEASEPAPQPNPPAS